MCTDYCSLAWSASCSPSRPPYLTGAGSVTAASGFRIGFCVLGVSSADGDHRLVAATIFAHTCLPALIITFTRPTWGG